MDQRIRVIRQASTLLLVLLALSLVALQTHLFLERDFVGATRDTIAYTAVSRTWADVNTLPILEGISDAQDVLSFELPENTLIGINPALRDQSIVNLARPTGLGKIAFSFPLPGGDLCWFVPLEHGVAACLDTTTNAAVPGCEAMYARLQARPMKPVDATWEVDDEGLATAVTYSFGTMPARELQALAFLESDPTREFRLVYYYSKDWIDELVLADSGNAPRLASMQELEARVLQTAFRWNMPATDVDAAYDGLRRAFRHQEVRVPGFSSPLPLAQALVVIQMLALAAAMVLSSHLRLVRRAGWPNGGETWIPLWRPSYGGGRMGARVLTRVESSGFRLYGLVVVFSPLAIGVAAYVLASTSAPTRNLAGGVLFLALVSVPFCISAARDLVRAVASA